MPLAAEASAILRARAGETVLLEGGMRSREGVLMLDSDPPGARVYVDGIPMGPAPVSGVDVAFGRESLCRRRELHFIGTSRDHSITQRNAAAESHDVTITRRDVDIPSCEALAADLDKHIGPPGFHEDSLFGYDG